MKNRNIPKFPFIPYLELLSFPIIFQLIEAMFRCECHTMACHAVICFVTHANQPNQLFTECAVYIWNGVDGANLWVVDFTWLHKTSLIFICICIPSTNVKWLFCGELRTIALDNSDYFPCCQIAKMVYVLCCLAVYTDDIPHVSTEPQNKHTSNDLDILNMHYHFLTHQTECKTFQSNRIVSAILKLLHSTTQNTFTYIEQILHSQHQSKWMIE